MTTNTKRAISIAAIAAAMILAMSVSQVAEATCRDCGEPNDLRVWADYISPSWIGGTHHMSDNLGVNVGAGETKANVVLVKQDEYGYQFPSFIVKSNSATPKTASYTVSYTVTDPTLGITANGSERYNNVVFTTYLNGESENFPHVYGMKKNTIITVSLQVHSVS